MPGDVNVAQVAGLLADPARARILLALLDGRALPAGDLARCARVSPSNASHHLRTLVEHQLLLVERQGRHRYFRLGSPAIAQSLEELAALAPAAPVRSLRESEVGRALRAARMCYNHFAGQFGVALAQRLVVKEILSTVSGGYLVTAFGEHWLQDVGIACATLGERGQIFAPHHIDWSERRHHVAGALGAALAQCFCERGWVKRLPTNRAVHLTEQGAGALFKELGLRLAESQETIST
jgi:DNA-binding transcriptional ArsR family regulator